MDARADPQPSILLIDDDRIHARILRAQLERGGFHVEVAASGGEGLALARRRPPEVILCDWIMEGIDGIELCHSVKQDERLANVYFILLTSLSEVHDRVVGLDSGADDFLTKPVVAEELLARVRAGLRMHEMNERMVRLAKELQRKQDDLERELNEAAAYVRGLLPRPLKGNVQVDSLFLPGQQLGGDCLDYRWIDADHLMFYVLDVSGHGIAATLPSLSLLHRLRSITPGDQLVHPEQLLAELNHDYPMAEQGGRYFTLWLGIYQRSSRQLRYATAGHPPGLLISVNGQQPIRRLSSQGMAIGLFEDAVFHSCSCRVDPGSSLLLFTDGIYENPHERGGSLSLDTFIESLPWREVQFSEHGLEKVLSTARKSMGMQLFGDDVSLLRVRFME